ncbi:MAG TPA: dynamin family protein [Dermatophilaceae bacterium]|nr:dynamin family protein [Dermatophilaceae bacterium]
MTAAPAGELSGLLLAVEALRTQVSAARLPLDLPDAAAASTVRTELMNQLDDYVLPRLRSLDAPLLVVVGGSTGAGKSTLVNSIVGSTVTKPGVLRPTTRSPVLVHHPDDEHWFAGDRVLPGLGRITGDASVEDPSSVRLVASPAIEPGLALLDAPDIDSVVASNRDLAAQLLSAADLWLFVTTAARYADAVPWGLLRQASERGTSVAIVLDRVPLASSEDIRDHLAGMLKEQSLSLAPIFTVPEVELGPDGLVPAERVGRLRSWLTALARDARARTIVVRNTLSGALDSIDGRVSRLAAASTEQLAATGNLAKVADNAFATAASGVQRGIDDGTLLRGEVMARWQEFVGTGEFFKQVETTVSRWRDRVISFVKGEPPPARDLGEALHSGVATLVTAEAEAAVAQIARTWRSMPGGSMLLTRDPALAGLSREFEEQVSRLVREWQDDVLELVRGEGQDRRTTAKVAAYGVNGVGVILMLVTFAHTGGVSGAEAGIAGGSAVLAQKLLEAIFGDQAVRTLAAKARLALIERVNALYAAEAGRFQGAVGAVEVARDQARRLSGAAEAVKAAR